MHVFEWLGGSLVGIVACGPSGREFDAYPRVVSNTRKFDHGLTQILHDDLHWLDVAVRV